METRLIQCAVCGAEIDQVTMQCPYCVAPPPAPAPETIVPVLTPATPAPRPAVPVPAPLPPPAATPDAERGRGLALFDAEEALARGAADKALVIASRIVKERPDNLTARALVERARRELLRGRRRERLEARLQEARALLAAGSVAAAEKIVTSALKLVPDHGLALELFAELKRRRLAAGSAEAEAEREIDRLAREQARRALEAARAAYGSGWARKALLELRRGLRLAPDDPDLLGLLKDIQRAGAGLDAERARRQASFAQVRAGLERLTQGDVDGALQILRAVLRDDPDNVRAQAAVQEVRRVWLARQTTEPTPKAAPAPAAGAARPVLASPPAAAARAVSVSRPTAPVVAPPRAVAPSRGSVPAEVLLPRTRRRSTPLAWVAAGAAILILALVGLTLHGGTPKPRPAAAQPAASLTAVPVALPSDRGPGPLDQVDPALRTAIEATLQAYGRALERADADLLAAARPDMTPGQREERLAPFRGALNAASDLRVLDVVTSADSATVSVLATDVIVGGRAEARPSQEETLRYDRRNGAWVLRRT